MNNKLHLFLYKVVFRCVKSLLVVFVVVVVNVVFGFVVVVASLTFLFFLIGCSYTVRTLFTYNNRFRTLCSCLCLFIYFIYVFFHGRVWKINSILFDFENVFIFFFLYTKQNVQNIC